MLLTVKQSLAGEICTLYYMYIFVQFVSLTARWSFSCILVIHRLQFIFSIIAVVLNVFCHNDDVS